MLFHIKQCNILLYTTLLYDVPVERSFFFKMHMAIEMPRDLSALVRAKNYLFVSCETIFTHIQTRKSHENIL